MKDKTINKIITFININNIYTESKLERIKYGLEGIYLTLSKLIIILNISILFNNLANTLYTLLFFNILRFFAFGFHANRSIECLIISIINFNIIPLILNQIPFNNITQIIIYIISLILFLIYAPADTPKRPMHNSKKRIKRKLLTLITTTIYIYIALKAQLLVLPIINSLIIEILMVIPLTYKIMNVNYCNYKKN